MVRSSVGFRICSGDRRPLSNALRTPAAWVDPTHRLAPKPDDSPYPAREETLKVVAEGVIMLFVSVGKPLPGDARPGIARRVQWNYPEGLKVIGEYWVQNPEMTVISVFEADSIAPIMAVNTEWSDTFSWTVSPAITAEDGIALFKSMPQ